MKKKKRRKASGWEDTFLQKNQEGQIYSSKKKGVKRAESTKGGPQGAGRFWTLRWGEGSDSSKKNVGYKNRTAKPPF